MKIPERRHWRRSGIFIVSFEHISTRSSEFWIISTGVLRKRCSENMQQSYKRTPIPKCDFNKVALQLVHGCSPVNLRHILRTSFSKNTSGWLLLKYKTVQFILDVKLQRIGTMFAILKFCNVSEWKCFYFNWLETWVFIQNDQFLIEVRVFILHFTLLYPFRGIGR